MKYAITPKGIGKRPGARCIRDETPLAPGETFTVADFTPDLVLAEDEVSLRAKTSQEIDLETAAVAAAVVEQDAQAVLAADCKADPQFDQLKSATGAQIATRVANVFPAFTGPQQAVMTLILKCCALFLRSRG